MRSVRIMMAGFFGFFLDSFLTSMIIGIGLPAVGLSVEDYALLQLGFSNPNVGHLLVGLILPLLATMVGGAVAGLLAPLDPQPAGALVGGFGLILWALDGIDPSEPYTGTRIIAQCLGTLLAALIAQLAVRYRRRQTS